MKKLKLFCRILIGFMIISCSSDDDNTTEVSPQFTINGTEYSTPNGYIFSFFDTDDSRSHSIFLMNGTIINNEWFGGACDYSSDFTQGILFNIRSTSITELEDGVYNYDLLTSEPTLRQTFILIDGVVDDNCLISNNLITGNQITSGNLIIETSGSIYTLSFTFQTNDFGTVSGSYVGELELGQVL